MSKIALEGNALGSGTFTIAAPNSNSNPTLTLPTSSGTVVVTGGAQTIEFAAGSAASPSITFTGDTNTGIFSPAADTIAFSEGGVESMRIDSSGRVGIGETNPIVNLQIKNTAGSAALRLQSTETSSNAQIDFIPGNQTNPYYVYVNSTRNLIFQDNATERMRIDSSGNVGIGITADNPIGNGGTYRNVLAGNGAGYAAFQGVTTATASGSTVAAFSGGTTGASGAKNAASINVELDGTSTTNATGRIAFYTSSGGSTTERARITSGGGFAMIKTDPNSLTTNGFSVDVISGNLNGVGICKNVGTWGTALWVNRLAAVGDGTLVEFATSGTSQGSISVSGATVSYNAFSGSHWSQFQQGRGYNPEILRGTVMSTIGEMCEWKSVVWDEVIEHPAVPAVEAKKAVLDEEGNIVEPAVEEVEGKDAWTETIQHRKSYLGQLPVGATFEEDGVTKTVVDDGNERLPKVKISDVVGDKAVYGVFQTYDDVQDMLVTSLGAFVVRIAAGVTVQIGDLLESNGDGCAKVQDDDVIRSRTIGKVTSTTPSATYADGSYTVPAVLYCG